MNISSSTYQDETTHSLRDAEDALGDEAEGANLRANLLQMTCGVVVLRVR